MKEINAFWEKRNTGLKTCELLFDITDSIKDYQDSFIEGNYEYIVTKVPKENVKLVHELEEIGFRFMETQFTISVATKELEKINKKWNRVLIRTSFKKLDDRKELELLLNKIKNGMFKEDRISLDDKLGVNISTRRYINWIVDIYEENTAEIFILQKNDLDAGFFIIKKVNSNTFQAIIAGVFNEYQGKGLSIALIYSYLKIAFDRNVKNVITSFSSNNQKMFNSFTKTVPFKTLEIVYVLRKINSIQN